MYTGSWACSRGDVVVNSGKWQLTAHSAIRLEQLSSFVSYLESLNRRQTAIEVKVARTPDGVLPVFMFHRLYRSGPPDVACSYLVKVGRYNHRRWDDRSQMYLERFISNSRWIMSAVRNFDVETTTEYLPLNLFADLSSTYALQRFTSRCSFYWSLMAANMHFI